MATYRRQAAGFPAVENLEEVRSCLNCFHEIAEDLKHIENNPNCLRLNVLTPHSVRGCIVCNVQGNVRKISAKCRANIFLVSNIYVPEHLKICEIHLDHSGILRGCIRK